MVPCVDPAGLVDQCAHARRPLARFRCTAAPIDYEGKPIASVSSTRTMQPLTFDQLLAMIPLRLASRCAPPTLRDSIQRLYQTGEYADIAVDATLAAAGVNLKFITKPAYLRRIFRV